MTGVRCRYVVCPYGMNYLLLTLVGGCSELWCMFIDDRTLLFLTGAKAIIFDSGDMYTTRDWMRGGGGTWMKKVCGNNVRKRGADAAVYAICVRVDKKRGRK